MSSVRPIVLIDCDRVTKVWEDGFPPFMGTWGGH